MLFYAPRGTRAAMTIVLAACGGEITHDPGGPSASSSGASSSSGGSSGASSSSGSSTSSGAPTPVTHGTFLAALDTGNGMCLPESFVRGANGLISCVIVEALPDSGTEDQCRQHAGLVQADNETITKIRTDYPAVLNDYPLCELAQIAPQSWEDPSTCAKNGDAGWCYVTGAEPSCPQTIQFTMTGRPLAGAEVWIACTE